jgi:hypothetical protein
MDIIIHFIMKWAGTMQHRFTQINRNVVYNFLEQTWTTGSLSRTSYNDAHTYGLPYATEFTF